MTVQSAALGRTPESTLAEPPTGRHPAPASPCVALTVASIAPKYGGPSRSIPALRDALVAIGCQVDIVTREGVFAPPPGTQVHAGDAPTTPAPLVGGFGRTLRRHMAAARVEIIHDNGVWLPTNHAAVAAARSRALPLVVSPRGMLEPWALKYRALKKQVAWRVYQRRDLASVSLFHATSQLEAESIRALGFRQPIAVIPNGTDLPALRTSRQSTGEHTAVFLSRIHPKKGLANLVDAWAVVRPPGWRMIIAGTDEDGHAAAIAARARAAGIERDFTFVGPVDGAEKLELLQSADLFVLPTHSENFGIVIAEALANGLPVITTKGAPWAALETEHCGWWVDVGVGPLADALRRAVAASDVERRSMGARGRDLARRRFAWEGIAVEMLAVYDWLRGAAPVPASVQHA